MEVLLSFMSWVLMGVGSFFVVVGAIGIWRFPDFYSRLHGAGVTDTLGAELVILGMVFQSFAILELGAAFLVTVKLLIIGLFLFFTSPTSTHAIANAALTAGLRPLISSTARRRATDPSQDESREE